MIERHQLDTPINRAAIDELPLDDMMAYIERIQQRRMEPARIYEAAAKLKEEAHKAKSFADMKKRLEQFVKVHQTVLNGIEKLEKYAQEIQGYRLILGDDIFNEEK